MSDVYELRYFHADADPYLEQDKEFWRDIDANSPDHAASLAAREVSYGGAENGAMISVILSGLIPSQNPEGLHLYRLRWINRRWHADPVLREPVVQMNPNTVPGHTHINAWQPLYGQATQGRTTTSFQDIMDSYMVNGNRFYYR